LKATRLYDEGSLVHLSRLDADTLAIVGRLRIIAWEASGPRPKMAPKVGDTWIDSHDDHAHHWIVMEEGRIVAAARMCVHSKLSELPDCEDLVSCEDKLFWPVASINRLVIHPECRRGGLAALFDAARIGLAVQLGAKSAVGCVHAEERMRGLGDLGFKVVGVAPDRAVPEAPTIVLMKVLG
jgi:hypothetical protein